VQRQELEAHLPVSRLFAIAASLSLAASACGGENLPTTPTVQPSSSPPPAPSPGPTAPAGYRVSGYVHGPGNVPVAGARVEAPAMAGMIVRHVRQTDGGGFFELDGLSGNAPFLVTAPGFRPFVRWVEVNNDLSLTFDLAPSLFSAGPHSLTISAAAECRDGLPEAARTRTYTAVIGDAFDYWEVGAYLWVTLSGASFWQDSRGRHHSFFAGYRQDSVEFFLLDYDVRVNTGTPRVVEQLTSSTALVIAGHANLSGTLNGAIYVVSTASGQDPDYRNPVAACRSDAHQFVLSR